MELCTNFKKKMGKFRISPNKETENITAFSNLDPIALLSFGDDLLLQTPTNVFLILTRNKRGMKLIQERDKTPCFLLIFFFRKRKRSFFLFKKDVIPQNFHSFSYRSDYSLPRHPVFADVHGEEVTFGSMDSIGKSKTRNFSRKTRINGIIPIRMWKKMRTNSLFCLEKNRDTNSIGNNKR